MFCENFAFFAKLFFDDNFAFRLFAKNAKIFALFAKFRLNLFREKVRNFCEKQISKFRKKNHGSISYDIIKPLMLSSQSKEFQSFFCAIDCSCYSTIGLCRVFFLENIFREILHHFRNFSPFSFFGKKCEILRNSLRNKNENFRIFWRIGKDVYRF